MTSGFGVWFILGVIVLTGFALRMHHLEDIALWLDETDFFNQSTYSAKPMPLIDFVVDRKDHTTSTPGWPAIMWVSARVFGRTAAAARTSTVFLGTAWLWLIFLILKRLTNSPAAGLIGAALAAISIPLIELSQRTYPYGALPFFSSLIILTHLWVVGEDSSGTRALNRLAPALLASSVVGSVSIFVNGTLAVVVGISYLVIVGTLLGEFRRYGRDSRLILTGLVGLSGLALFVTAIAGAKNPRYGNRVYLQDYYHSFDLGAIPFLLHHTYDLLTYQLNLFFEPSLYWPLAANPVMLPLVIFCFVGCVLAVAGKFGLMARRVAILGLVSFAAAALLSLRGSFPYGGLRQSLFLAPFVIAFTALGLYALRRNRWLVTAAALLAIAYIGLWVKYLPAFYADRIIPFQPREIIETWERNGKLVFYDQTAGRTAIRYWTRNRPEIEIKNFGDIPSSSFLLISINWPLEQSNWDPHLMEKLQAAGFNITLLKACPSRHMASWKYPTCLYFPPSGLWIYKCSRS